MKHEPDLGSVKDEPVDDCEAGLIIEGLREVKDIPEVKGITVIIGMSVIIEKEEIILITLDMLIRMVVVAMRLEKVLIGSNQGNGLQDKTITKVSDNYKSVSFRDGDHGMGLSISSNKMLS